MNKLLSLLSLLIALSLTAFSPAYAGSHEKKADDAVATEATKTEEVADVKATDEKTAEKSEDGKDDAKDKDDAKKSDDGDKKKKKGKDGEEPECE